MFKVIHIKKSILDFLHRINIRIMLLVVLMIGLAGGWTYRLFQLQIVNGENYLNNFQLRIRREVTIPSTRGNIYDRNGNLLAYNELAYSVTIKDVYEDTSLRDQQINETISKVIDILDRNGDSITGDFNIILNEDGEFEYNVSDTSLLRFLADIYGHASTDDLTYEEKTRTAGDAVLDLAERYEIGEKEDPEDSATSFIAGKGYSDKRLLQMVIVRYNLSLNNFQKYLSTSIATDVSEQTVADIMEGSDDLLGVDIEEETVRKYVDSTYFSQIIGYTGKVSTEELKELQKTNPDYSSSDIVGKAGIESSMEEQLQGTKGSKTVFVDSVGKELQVTDEEEPVAGNDVYLTIDKDLQEAATDILERRLASILVAKIRNIKEFDTSSNTSSSNIVIPIYDVYFAVINNNVVSTSHFSQEDAGTTEKAVYSTYQNYVSALWDTMEQELYTAKTPYNKLTKEYKTYESYLVSALYDKGVLERSLINEEDETYQNWTTNETISLTEFLEYAIAQNWVDVTRLSIESKYADSAQVFDALWDYTKNLLSQDSDFTKKIYKYMILNDVISGSQICQILIEQDLVDVQEMEKASLEAGTESAYDFMIARIENLDLTPAQLNLDPYSGSMVITDVNSGEVLALVTYPSYDNNRMSNGVDAEYYASLRNNLSRPLINYATQQKTAPGSTFKPVSAAAGLMEGVITLATQVDCTGTFEKIQPSPHCWIYPSSHGNLDVSGAIQNSCNVFFYELGYRLGEVGNTYSSDVGVTKLQKYADMFGLSDTSGIEIEEASPQMASEDAVRSAIGQSDSGYTTVGLARYVTTVANSGTCYNLTLIQKVEDSDGNTLLSNSATIRNVIDMDQRYWNAIHLGMRKVVQDKTYFDDMPIAVAGKTGTAQETTSRPNHALFICYAPYESPQIAVATRVANGYTSDYAAQITEDVLKYYFNVEDRDDLLDTGTQMNSGNISAD